jgi:hypothetical protein
MIPLRLIIFGSCIFAYAISPIPRCETFTPFPDVAPVDVAHVVSGGGGGNLRGLSRS